MLRNLLHIACRIRHQKGSNFVSILHVKELLEDTTGRAVQSHNVMRLQTDQMLLLADCSQTQGKA